MKNNYDADMVNTINTENYKQEREERELRNKILAMGNTERKQEMWRKFFTLQQTSDDSYLAGGVY